jgi:glycosyltransferase involved in cell wall biosynthesis
VFTAADPAELAAFGIRPNQRVRLAMASRAQVLAAQRAADILFLPIAFEANEHVAITASPTKMPEYLASGTPILVHAPPHAFVTKYAEERGFAEVVKAPDRAALAAAVRRLTLEPEVRERLSAHALETLALHDVDLVARRMEAGIDQGLAAGRA